MGQAAAAAGVVGGVAVEGGVVAAGAAAVAGAAAAEAGADVGGAGAEACHHDLMQLQDGVMCSSWDVYASEKQNKR